MISQPVGKRLIWELGNRFKVNCREKFKADGLIEPPLDLVHIKTKAQT
tara:strand:- start:130 stop:273 length:144 start_codon:yes stop_codon:yes gene_type:complete